MTEPTKGILKDNASSSPRKNEIHWDETGIALHDLERGRTMKISEPKTPFVHYDAKQDEILNEDEIPDFSLGGPKRNESFPHVRVGKEEKSKEKPSEPVEDEDEEEAQDDEEQERHAKFNSKRGSHYHGEAANALRLAQQLKDEDDEDDESKPGPVPPIPAQYK